MEQEKGNKKPGKIELKQKRIQKCSQFRKGMMNLEKVWFDII